jgi:cobalt-zinc-cadmium resistance protein CzcA
MPLEAGDIYVIMKPKSEWTSASTREEMFEKMEAALEMFPGVIYEFTQPIQMLFNELMTGVRQDIAIKIYGADLGLLAEIAREAEALLQTIPGISDIKVEATVGLQQLVVRHDREKMAKYGMTIAEVNDILKMAFAGKVTGQFYEGQERYDIVVRLSESERLDISQIPLLPVKIPNGTYIPLRELATISFEDGPSQISRDDTKRRITIGVNTRNSDIQGVIEAIQEKFENELALPSGYHIKYGGQFENLQRARERLSVVVPIALGLIFVLLYFTFESVGLAVLIFSAIPLSAIGGIWSLHFRDMPFSISAGVGFIALFGVAVLNGIVLISSFNDLRKRGVVDIHQILIQGTKMRLRPILMTAAVASMGFLPMAVSTSAGAEVQRPLATVVIGGLITATLLTLLILPILYSFYDSLIHARRKRHILTAMMLALIAFPGASQSPQENGLDELLVNYLNQHDLKKAQEAEIRALEYQKVRPLPGLPGSIQFRGDEFNFNGNSGVQGIGFNKAFYLPALADSYTKLYDKQIAFSNASYGVKELSLLSPVIEKYLLASLAKAKLATRNWMLDRYQDYLEQYQALFEVGATGTIDRDQVVFEMNDLTVQLIRDSSHMERYVDYIHNLTNGTILQVEDLGNLYNSFNEGNGVTHPLINALRASRETIEAGFEVTKAQNLPTLQGSAALQSVGGDVLYFGYGVGINIPFSRKYLESRTLARDEQIRSSEFTESWTGRELNIRKQNLVVQANVLEDELMSLNEVLIPEIEQLLERLSEAFRNGETTFIQIRLAEEERYKLLLRQSEIIYGILHCWYMLKYNLY